MKTATYYQRKAARPAIRFPNATVRKNYLQKFLDTALMCAIGIGLSVSVLFLLTLS